MLKMKVQQLLMRIYDRLIQVMEKADVGWYPGFIFWRDSEDWKAFEDEIHKLEVENDRLMYHLVNESNRVQELEEKLYFYEPWENDNEES